MGSVGRFVYAFFNQLVARDLHHLEEIEDRAQALEDQVLNNQLKEFTAPMDRPAEGIHRLVPLLLPAGRRGL